MTKVKMTNRTKPTLSPRNRNIQPVIKARAPIATTKNGYASPAATVSVMIADDHTFLRESLHSLIATDKNFTIVAEADNGRKAVDLALEKRPNVLLMDIGMPRLNGLEAARQIRHLAPEVKVILLTAFSTDQYIQKMVDEDIQGYLLKDSPSNLLLHAIQEVSKGNRFFSPSISRRMKSIYDDLGAGGDQKKAVKLTCREVEVLQLIAEGGANKQIAGELNISIKTVEKHRQNLMDKLRIHDTASLTRYAISSGVIDNMVQTLLPLQ